jgi:rod shape-determining protein MreC
MDHQFNYFARFRSTLSVVVAPIQFFVDRPVGFIRWAETSFTTQQNLLMENAQLRARQLLLYAKLQKVIALENENDQLKALLRSSSNIHEKVTVAQLLAVDLAPYTQQIIIDKGVKDDVYIGQPVLDAYGVMGQIIAVGPINSRVLLITDTRSAIPVQDNRNGNRAIASGLGIDGSLELINVPITTDYKKGDFLVTSGLGGHYPPGYPVGIINKVKLSPGERFLNINITPAAHVNQSRQVLLVWPKKSSFNHLPPINLVPSLFFTQSNPQTQQQQASTPTQPQTQAAPQGQQNNQVQNANTSIVNNKNQDQVGKADNASQTNENKSSKSEEQSNKTEDDSAKSTTGTDNSQNEIRYRYKHKYGNRAWDETGKPRRYYRRRYDTYRDYRRSPAWNERNFYGRRSRDMYQPEGMGPE